MNTKDVTVERAKDVDIRKIDTLPEHPDLHKEQKVKLLVDFYDGVDTAEDRQPVHRKGDVGCIDGFGILCDQEIVAVEVCYHGTGSYTVIPVLPSDLERVSDETSLTEPDRKPEAIEDFLSSLEDDPPPAVDQPSAGVRRRAVRGGASRSKPVSA